jgi:Cu(I)/Ag(I) efflux system membrane fusion protein
MRVLLFVLILFSGMPATLAAQDYICPMHPHIHGELGDTCPICGMALVPAGGDVSMSHEGHDMETSDPAAELSITPEFIQSLGIKTTEVSHHKFGQNIRAFGRVVPNTREEHRIDIRSEGWITRLETDAIGDTVKKGDLLFTYYSPDLLVSASDYLLQMKGNKVFGNPEMRLKLEGMDEIAIAQLKQKGELIYEIPFHAPTDGTVSVLNIRDGSFVKAGETLMVLNDFSKVWINADIPVRYMQFLKPGDPANVILPDIGLEFQANIDFIHPILNADTRTGMVRLTMENTDGMLHPDHYVDVLFTTDIKPRLAVPKQAILYSADGAYVFESLGKGRFRPVMVETGITSEGITEIKSGLEHGQKIVSSGQFLLDAESNLKGGMEAMGHEH